MCAYGSPTAFFSSPIKWFGNILCSIFVGRYLFSFYHSEKTIEQFTIPYLVFFYLPSDHYEIFFYYQFFYYLSRWQLFSFQTLIETVRIKSCFVMSDWKITQLILIRLLTNGTSKTLVWKRTVAKNIFFTFLTWILIIQIMFYFFYKVHTEFRANLTFLQPTSGSLKEAYK